MRATQQVRYAIYGIFDLAYNGGSGSVPLAAVGKRQAIPSRYLEQIFQKLRRAGLVESKRGPGGGYRLSRSASAIRLGDVVRAVQGAVLARSDLAPGPATSPEFVWELLAEDLRGTLDARSVADLCREAAARGVARSTAEPASYDI
jgi:Rrf2 family protein